ncbi:peptidoglycan DD-metalloendopeptidase family protein [Niabella terrae]
MVLLLIAGLPSQAQKATDKTALEQERSKLQAELRQIQQAYDAVAGQSKNNLHQLAALSKKIEVQEQYINNIGREVRLLNDDIYYSAIEIKKLKENLDTLKAQYARTIVYAYKNRSNYNYLNFIFSANNFNDAIRRIAYLKSYSNYRQQQIGDIVKTRDLISRRYDYQKATIQNKKLAIESRSDQVGVLAAQKSEKDSVLRTLQSQVGSLQQQIARKKEQDRELKSSIAAIIRKEIAEARRTAQEQARQQAAAAAQQRVAVDAEARLRNLEKAASNSPVAQAPPSGQNNTAPALPRELPKSERITSGAASNIRELPSQEVAINVNTGPVRVATPVAPKAKPAESPPSPPPGGYLNVKSDDIALNADFSQNRGKLPAPVAGVITLGFGRYKIEGMGPDIVGDNPGVTYTTQVGAAVKAVFDGEVVSISRVGGMSFVVMRHGKYFTAYSNLATVSVSKGAIIARGTPIGTAGIDLESGQGKLDFLLMIEERNVDPAAWLR